MCMFLDYYIIYFIFLPQLLYHVINLNSTIHKSDKNLLGISDFQRLAFYTYASEFCLNLNVVMVTVCNTIMN